MALLRRGPADQPDTSIVLHPPAADPGVTDDGIRDCAFRDPAGNHVRINELR